MNEWSLSFIKQLGFASAILFISGLFAFFLIKKMKMNSWKNQVFIWWMVLIQGVLVFHFSVLIPWYQQESVTDNNPVLSSSISSEIIEVLVPEDQSILPPIPVNEIPEISFGSTLQIHWPIILVTVWLAGILVCLVRWIHSTRQFYRDCHSLECDHEEWNQEWAEVREQEGIQTAIPLHVSHDSGPVLCRRLREYQLVVPFTLWKQLNEVQRKAILLHELEHYQRGDIWKSLVTYFIVLIHWFNPLVWFVARRIELCSEWACDEAVIKKSKNLSMEYAKMLLELAEVSQKSIIWNSTFTGSSLSKRVKRILSSDEKDTFMKKFLPLLILLFLTFVNTTKLQLVAKEPLPAQKKIKVNNQLKESSPKPVLKPVLKAVGEKQTDSSDKTAKKIVKPITEIHSAEIQYHQFGLIGSKGQFKPMEISEVEEIIENSNLDKDVANIKIILRKILNVKTLKKYDQDPGKIFTKNILRANGTKTWHKQFIDYPHSTFKNLIEYQYGNYQLHYSPHQKNVIVQKSQSYFRNKAELYLFRDNYPGFGWSSKENKFTSGKKNYFRLEKKKILSSTDHKYLVSYQVDPVKYTENLTIPKLKIQFEFHRGLLESAQFLIVDEVKINKGLDEKDFFVEIPAGTQILDKRNTIYKFKDHFSERGVKDLSTYLKNIVNSNVLYRGQDQRIVSPPQTHLIDVFNE